MHRRTAIAALAAGTLVRPLAALAQAERPVVLGLLPNVSTRVLFASWQPFVRYMERSAGRKVELATATGFKAHHERTIKGDYDLAVTAANLGRLAEREGAMTAVAICEPPLEAVAVVGRTQPLASLTELRGKRLALANPQSLVALYGLAWLRESGLASGADFEILHVRNDDSLGHALRSGESPLAIMSGTEFHQIDPAIRRELQIFKTFATVPGFFILARPQAKGGNPATARAWMQGFAASNEGREFFQATGQKDIRAITDADRASVERYVEPTRQRLME